MIRPATAADLPALLTLIRELAAYERAADEVKADPAALHAALFGPDAVAGALVATDGPAGPVIGMALWFRNFSTWTGRCGIYLEDLYVAPAHRGAGHGAALLAGLARECLRRGYPRLEWSVLDWNAPAIGFYRSLGAEAMDSWTVHRLSGAALHALAARGSG